MNLISKTLFIVILLATCIGGRAAEVVYRLVDYNKSTGEFTLAASGQVPKGAWAYFDSKYGARPLRRAIQTQLEDKMANEILEGHIHRGDTTGITHVTSPGFDSSNSTTDYSCDY